MRAPTRGVLSRAWEVVTTRTTPEDGDSVVRQERRDGTIVYVLHTAPGPDQDLFRTYPEAVADAVTLAEGHGVRAWPTTDVSHDFVLVGRVAMRTIDDVLHRLRAEFLEMPCLRLTSAQVQRLCGIEREVCEMVLDALVKEKFLCVSDGHYARLTTGHHAHPAKAHLRTERAKKAS